MLVDKVLLEVHVLVLTYDIFFNSSQFNLIHFNSINLYSVKLQQTSRHLKM